MATRAERPVPVRGPGRPPRSPAARAAQRARLLEGAIVAIRRVGPEASVDEMAAEAGVSKPVLYSEFGDKHGIAEAIAVDVVRRAERNMAGDLADGVELRKVLGLAIEGFFDVVTADPAIYGFIFRSIRTNDRGLFDNALVRSLDKRFELLAGVLAPDADPDLVHVAAHGTFGFALAAIESWLATRAPSREVLIDVLADALTAALESAAAHR